MSNLEQDEPTGAFTIVSDNDAHRYVIPVSMLSDWDKWCAIPSDDERSWHPPRYAEAVGGRVVFPSYEVI